MISKTIVHTEYCEKVSWLNSLHDQGSGLLPEQRRTLNVLDHLPYAAGAYAGTETTAYAFVFIDNIFE
jgi:hypothetical protein